MSQFSFRAGTLWGDEIPPYFEYEATQVLSFTLENVPVLHRKAQTLCFKIHIIREKVDFGALGFIYTPDESGRLLVEVHVAENESQKIMTGLTSEYAPYILRKSKALLLEHNVFGSGHLVFKYGFEHSVNSSPRLFRLLTRILFTLRSRDTMFFTEDEMKTFIFDEEKKLHLRSYPDGSLKP